MSELLTEATPTRDALSEVAAILEVSTPLTTEQFTAIAGVLYRMKLGVRAQMAKALAEKVRAISDEYERNHAQSQIDEAEFGPKAGAHNRWAARQEAADRILALIEDTP